MPWSPPSSDAEHFRYIETRDVELARAALRRLLGEVAFDARRLAFRAAFVDLGPVTIFHGESRADTFVLRGTPSVHAVLLPVRPGVEARVGPSTVHTEPGRRSVVYSAGETAELRQRGDGSNIALCIDPAFLTAQLEALTGAQGLTAPRFEPALDLARGHGAALAGLVHFLLAEVERGSDTLLHPLVCPGLAETLVRALLLGQPHDHTSLLSQCAPAADARVVRLVEEHLDAHAGEPLPMAELAALTGHGLPSLDAAFRAHRGHTAREFLLRRRLDLARQRLLGPDPGTTVDEVATAAGFLRRDHFASAYAAQFGESPAETRGRAHRASEAPREGARPDAAPGWPVVFVVDADADRLRRTSRMLKEAGHAVQAHTSARSFLAALGEASAGCAVIDLPVPDLSGPELEIALAKARCPLPLVFVAREGEPLEAVESLAAEVADMLVEPLTDDELREAVARALGRDAEGRAARAERARIEARVEALSPRERQVCERVRKGMLNKQIAAELGISEATVKVHRAHAMTRLRVSSAAELVRLLDRAEGA